MKHKRLSHLAAAACTLALVLSLRPVAKADSGFQDVPASHWAYQAILDAANSGITGGYADGTFRPGGEVTYAQFTAFLARAFYGSPTQSTSSPWYQVYLDAVRGDGVLDGVREQTLSKSIHRYDMARMLYRVMAAKGDLPEKSLREAAGKKLPDWSSIPETYRDAVSACVAAGTLNGLSDGSFGGSNPMNRAQACAVIARLRQSLKGGSSEAPPQSADIPLAELRSGLVKLINRERSGGGVKAVESSSQLDSAAQILIGAVVKGYYETLPDGRQWAYVIPESGFPVGENTTAVQLPVQSCATPETVLAYMKGTPDVWDELLNGNYTHVGIGYLKDGGSHKDCWNVLLVGNPSSPQTSQPENLCAELTHLVNAQRAKAGLSALGTMDRLTQAAQLRAKDLSGGYLETRPDGSDWSSALDRTGVQAVYVDESFVVGYHTAADALTIILNTESARNALLNKSYTHLGIGYVHDPNGYQGYQDFWSLMYIQADGSSSGGSPGTPSGATGSLSYTPVPMKDLANRKSLQKKATDEQLAQAYAEAAKLVEPYANLPLEQKLSGICNAIRQRFDSGMSYTMESDHYNDPYGFFIQGGASCAGCTRATGLCLNILGIPYEHVNENQYLHQWCRVKVGGSYWICDPYGLYCGPEPAPYQHANPLLS